MKIYTSLNDFKTKASHFVLKISSFLFSFEEKVEKSVVVKYVVVCDGNPVSFSFIMQSFNFASRFMSIRLIMKKYSKQIPCITSTKNNHKSILIFKF